MPVATAQERLFQMIVGYFVSQITYLFARLNVAEAVGDGVGQAELVSKLGGNADGATRFLRASASLGLLLYAGGKYRLTELGTLLRGDAAGSLKSFAAAIPAESHWLPWGRFSSAVATGMSPLPETFGGDVWAYFNAHPAELEGFAGAMGDLSNIAAQQAVAAYDFASFETIVDIGGSHGVVLAHLLRAAPKAQGVLFDMPKVIEGAPPELARRGVAGRVKTMAGDFFKEVPAGGDLYVMKNIIHDWDDARAEIILHNCAAAARPNATLVLIELVLPDEPGVNPVPYLMDLNMLVMVDGRERTPAEYRALLARAGWTLKAVVPTQGFFSLVEATKS